MATQDVNSFKFWANKIIPLVYDDSLSYYEFLCKVLQKLNEVIGSVNDQNSTIKDMQDQIDAFIAAEQQAREDWELTETANRAAWELQQAQKMSAFEQLFVSDYDSTKSYTAGNVCRHEGLIYAANGSTTGSWNSAKWNQIVLADYLAAYVQTAAANMQAQYDDFLEDYQRQFGVQQSVGASTTDVISQYGIAQLLNMSMSAKNLIDWRTVLNNTLISRATGAETTNTSYVSTPFIAVGSYTQLHNENGYCIVWYDSNYDFISASSISQDVNNVPENAAYFRASTNVTNVGRTVICDQAEWVKGLPARLPVYSSKTVRATTSMSNAGFARVSNINVDGIYSYAAANAPEDLPPVMSGKGGAIISIGIGDNKRLYMAISYATTDQLMYIKLSTESSWQRLNQNMLRTSALSITDFNELTTAGQTYFFSAADVANVLHKPFSNINGIVTVYAQNQYRVQVAISNALGSGAKTIAIRGMSSSTDWSDWYTIEGENPYRGKTINWLGDSIVAGEEFDEIVADYFGMNLNDYGSPGARIAYKAGMTQDCLSVTYADMTDTCDIIAVSGGTNDFQNSWTPFGTVTDTTNDTFCGAMNVLCLGLINKYPDKQIFFTTPIKRAQSESQTVDTVNQLGKKMIDYCNAIKEICARYSIPVLDMYSECLLNPQIPAQKSLFFKSDGIHPNAAGRQIMARRVIGWLRQLM